VVDQINVLCILQLIHQRPSEPGHNSPPNRLFLYFTPSEDFFGQSFNNIMELHPLGIAIGADEFFLDPSRSEEPGFDIN